MLAQTDTTPAAFVVALNPKGRAAMTRDMELVGKILQAIKARKTTELAEVNVSGDPAIVLRHLEMLVHEKLVDGLVHYDGDVPDQVLVRDMSWDGHDFVSILENQTVWNRLKQKFTPAEFATLTLTVIKSVGLKMLTDWAESQAGLK
jgi:hypothetical protein